MRPKNNNLSDADFKKFQAEVKKNLPKLKIKLVKNETNILILDNKKNLIGNIHFFTVNHFLHEEDMEQKAKDWKCLQEFLQAIA